MKLVTLGMFCAAFAIVFTTVPVLKAQKSNGTPAAPVPAQIITSTKVFISNAGADSTSLTALRNAEEPDQPYNELYAAMKSWGRYELVAAPADADLVFEIRFTAPLTDCGQSNHVWATSGVGNPGHQDTLPAMDANGAGAGCIPEGDLGRKTSIKESQAL